MKTSAWLVWPVLAISTSALVLPSPTDASHDVTAIAGSIAPASITDVSNSTKSRLELEYETLEVLKHKLHELHHEVLRKERDILHIINQDFRSCSGVTCYLQTALKKAPDFFELFKTHFRHNAKSATGSSGCFWSANSTWMVTVPEPLDVPPESPFNFKDGPPHGPFDFGAPAHPHPPPPPPHPESPDSSRPPHPPHPPHPAPLDFAADEPAHHRPGHHGPPPHHDSHEPNDIAPAYHGHKPHHERPPFHMPHPAPRPRHFRLILATVGLVTSLLILTALFKGLRIYCANPRVRAERAARIEECRNRREYRRAACKHRFQQVLSRFLFRRRSHDPSTTDYEEKRSMLRRGNTTTSAIPPTTMDANVEDHIIGSNIASLRRAHEIVGQLMLAEEGRSHSFSFAAAQSHPQLQICPQFQPETNTRYHNQNLPSSSRSVHSIHTTTTLPAYIPPPPRYSQELARETRDVVDGFRYTPTQSGHTPSSSTSSPSTFMLDDGSENDNDRPVTNMYADERDVDGDGDVDGDVDVGTESSVADCISRMSFATETEADAEVMRGRLRRKGSFELAGDQYIGRFD